MGPKEGREEREGMGREGGNGKGAREGEERREWEVRERKRGKGREGMGKG